MVDREIRPNETTTSEEQQTIQIGGRVMMKRSETPYKVGSIGASVGRKVKAKESDTPQRKSGSPQAAFNDGKGRGK